MLQVQMLHVQMPSGYPLRCPLQGMAFGAGSAAGLEYGRAVRGFRTPWCHPGGDPGTPGTPASVVLACFGDRPVMLRPDDGTT